MRRWICFFLILALLLPLVMVPVWADTSLEDFEKLEVYCIYKDHGEMKDADIEGYVMEELYYVSWQDFDKIYGGEVSCHGDDLVFQDADHSWHKYTYRNNQSDLTETLYSGQVNQTWRIPSAYDSKGELYLSLEHLLRAMPVTVAYDGDETTLMLDYYTTVQDFAYEMLGEDNNFNWHELEAKEQWESVKLDAATMIMLNYADNFVSDTMAAISFRLDEHMDLTESVYRDDIVKILSNQTYDPTVVDVTMMDLLQTGNSGLGYLGFVNGIAPYADDVFKYLDGLGVVVDSFAIANSVVENYRLYSSMTNGEYELMYHVFLTPPDRSPMSSDVYTPVREAGRYICDSIQDGIKTEEVVESYATMVTKIGLSSLIPTFTLMEHCSGLFHVVPGISDYVDTVETLDSVARIGAMSRTAFDSYNLLICDVFQEGSNRLEDVENARYNYIFGLKSAIAARTMLLSHADIAQNSAGLEQANGQAVASLVKAELAEPFVSPDELEISIQWLPCGCPKLYLEDSRVTGLLDTLQNGVSTQGACALVDIGGSCSKELIVIGKDFKFHVFTIVDNEVLVVASGQVMDIAPGWGDGWLTVLEKEVDGIPTRYLATEDIGGTGSGQYQNGCTTIYQMEDYQLVKMVSGSWDIENGVVDGDIQLLKEEYRINDSVVDEGDYEAFTDYGEQIVNIGRGEPGVNGEPSFTNVNDMIAFIRGL